VLLRPACQPVLPPSIVAAAHQLAPSPLPCSAGRVTCHAVPPARAAAGPSTSVPPHCPARGLRTVTMRSAPDARAVHGLPPQLDQAIGPWPSRPSGRPRVAGRWAACCSRELISNQHCAADFKSFPIVFNSRNCFKLTKFVETYRNVQKLRNKFCWTPLESLYTVGLTKLTFIQ
jgi:hypothetical protein